MAWIRTAWDGRAIAVPWGSIPRPPEWLARMLQGLTSWRARRWMAQHFPGVGFHEISGFRTPEHNAEVGGAENSAHLFGLAVDLRIAEPSAALLRNIADTWAATVPGGFAEAKTTAVHLNYSRNEAWLAARAITLAGAGGVVWFLRRAR